MKQLLKPDSENRQITVVFKDIELCHTVASYATAEKYQFEINFDERKEVDTFEDE